MKRKVFLGLIVIIAIFSSYSCSNDEIVERTVEEIPVNRLQSLLQNYQNNKRLISRKQEKHSCRISKDMLLMQQ